MNLVFKLFILILFISKVQADVSLPAYLKRTQKQPFELKVRFLPEKKEIWITGIQINDRSLANKAKSLTVAVKNISSGTTIFSQNYGLDVRNRKISGLELKNDNAYQVTGFLLDADKKSIASAQGKTVTNIEDFTSGRYSVGGMIRNAHLKNWVKPYPVAFDTLRMKNYPFENNKLGCQDAVLSAFAPLQFQDDKLSCWGRVYSFDNLGLPTKISASQPEPTVGEKTEELLAGPITLQLKMKSKSSKVLPVGKLKVIKRRKTDIVLEGAGKAGTLGFKVTDRIGQDGLIKVTLEIIPEQPTDIEELSLEIPLDGKQISLMHEITDVVYRRLDRSKRGLAAGIGGHAGYLPLTPKNGEVWSSLNTEKRKIYGSFQPFIWLGNEDRGLCWFADSDRNWLLPPDKPALQLFREQDRVILKVNFIGKNASLKHARSITFGLLATPVKKAMKNWRGTVFPRWATLDRKFYRSLKNLRKLIMVGAGDPNFNAGEASPLALDWNKTKNKYAELKDEKGSTYFEYWCSDYLTADVPELEKYFSEWINPLQIGWFRKLYPRFDERSCTWLPVNRTAKSLQDYKVWCLNKKLKEVGDFAFYEDNSHPRVFDDPVWGEGFNISANKRQPEFDLFLYHDYLKRLAAVYENNSCDNLLGVHSSASMLIPAFTYASFYIDGEQPARYDRDPDKDYIDVWPELDYIRAHVMGRQFGINTIFLSEMTFSGKDPSGKHSRALLALMLPHDIAIWDGAVKNREPIKKWHKIKNDFGFYGNESRLYPYWAAGANSAASISPSSKVLVTVWKINSRLLLMISNLDKSSRTFDLTLKPGNMGLSGIAGTGSCDAETHADITVSGNQLKNITVPGHDYRIFRINGK